MKKIAFLSGTRADWGKIKPLIEKVRDHKDLEYKIFACGMHLLELYGRTFIEIFKDGFNEVFLAKPHDHGEKMDLALSDSIKQFSSFIQNYQPDLIIVHGDRLESLAGAIVGSFNNILVGHIEGGEISGTIDESIRHSVSKLAHLHFVANAKAKKRLIQLGEKREHIFIIGSPDLDVMNSPNLPSFDKVQEHYYQIKSFNKNYAIFSYHPVTTEIDQLQERLEHIISALKNSKKNFIVIYPNNDPGSHIIIDKIQSLRSISSFVTFTSIKFEYFLTLLRNASFIIGNSSAGVREAPFFGVPCINLGSRQQGRYEKNECIISCSEEEKSILEKIALIPSFQSLSTNKEFGEGKSAEQFIRILQRPQIWETPLQKRFADLL